MMAKVRSRIIEFLQLSQCKFVLDGNKIQTCHACLIFTEEALCITRPGKPERQMAYEKLNIDRLLFLINPALESRLTPR